MAQNIFGEPLQPCSMQPLTGFLRDGCCNTAAGDRGMHLACAVMTAEFLEFSKSRGNDLSTPHPEFRFPGLVPGDRWCLCAARWVEALEAGCAPKLVLESCHALMLEYANLADLEKHRA
jgi:uncharacterized protein (DUF2237 family)